MAAVSVKGLFAVARDSSNIIALVPQEHQIRMRSDDAIRNVQILPNKSCAGTKTIPERASVHTQEQRFWREFYDGAKLRRADLEIGASLISDRFCFTLSV